MSTLRLGVVLGILASGFSGCSVGSDQDNDDGPNENVIGASAGGETHIISDDWEVASVRLGNNLKMLSFSQMQAEMLRATTIEYANWAENRAVFGSPDFKTSFLEDRTPTATKILTWRKIAFDVCGAMVKKETSTPALFSSISPTATISAEDPKVAAQITAMFKKFFLERPTSADVEASTKALVDTVAAGGPPTEAWSSLCVAYLSSMRFLTY